MCKIGHWTHQTFITPDIEHTRHWSHQTLITLDIDHIVCRIGSHRVVNVLFYTRCDQCLVWSMSGVINVLLYTQCDQCLVWLMSGVINVWCDQCPLWSMSYFTHGVINVWCDQCLVWSMSFFTHSVINVWCDQCLCDQCRTIRLTHRARQILFRTNGRTDERTNEQGDSRSRISGWQIILFEISWEFLQIFFGIIWINFRYILKIFLADIECCGTQTHKLFWDFPRGKLHAAFGVVGVGTEIPTLEKKHIWPFKK